jgi:hypothetical protein
MPGGMSDFLELEVLDHLLSAATYTAPATTHVSLFTVVSADGATFTEPVGNAYARVAVTNNATNWPAAGSGLKSNGTAITFPKATPGGWGTIRGWGIHDAASAGNLLFWGLLARNEEIAVVDDIATNLFKCPGHGFTLDMPVAFQTLPSVALPTGVVAGTTYYARTITTNSFAVAAAPGGAEIDITVVGGGLVWEDLSKTVAAEDTASFAVGELDITQD